MQWEEAPELAREQRGVVLDDDDDVHGLMQRPPIGHQDVITPIMPRTLDEQVTHRDKLKRKLYNVINALVARPVGRHELLATKGCSR